MINLLTLGLFLLTRSFTRTDSALLLFGCTRSFSLLFIPDSLHLDAMPSLQSFAQSRVPLIVANHVHTSSILFSRGIGRIRSLFSVSGMACITLSTFVPDMVHPGMLLSVRSIA